MIDNFIGKTILIVGTTGTIGVSLVDVLSQINCNIYALSRNPETLKTYDINIIAHDITQPLILNIDFDYIIHLASMSSPNFFVENPVEIIKSNILGIVNICDYVIKRQNKTRILYISSGEYYGVGFDKPCIETDFGYIDYNNIRNCYPVSKRTSEMLCQSYMQEYGLDIVIARPSHIYSKNIDHDNKVFSEFMKNAIKKQPITLKSIGDTKRSMCYILDVVDGILTILHYGITGQAYNVSSDEIISIKNLAKLISKLSNVNIKYNIQNNICENQMKNAILDNNKLKALGWIPKYNLETIIKEILKERFCYV